MVKKRIRDAEGPPEAPLKNTVDDDGSGSDEVTFILAVRVIR
jgi:hypothetical protein